MGLETFDACATAGFFAEAQEQSLLDAYLNHSGYGKYDFAFNEHSNDRWTIGDRTYNAHEFGNVLAGYTGGFLLGERLGGGIVSVAGAVINVIENRTESDGDKTSRPYINLGVSLGARDKREGRSGPVCSCGAGK